MWEEVKCKIAIMAIFILFLGYTGPVFVEAATRTAHVTLTFTVESSSRLTLNDSSNNPNVKSGATASVRSGAAPAILTVAAIDDLTNVSDSDPIAGATATAMDPSGNLFLSPPAARNEAVPRNAAGQGCSASYSETFNWYLEKSWNCDTGKRTVTVIYTLTSP
ncbi:MAG: hypothetical protein ACLP3B_14420 [Syntrophobacteraceae bacterium]